MNVVEIIINNIIFNIYDIEGQGLTIRRSGCIYHLFIDKIINHEQMSHPFDKEFSMYQTEYQEAISKFLKYKAFL